VSAQEVVRAVFRAFSRRLPLGLPAVAGGPLADDAGQVLPDPVGGQAAEVDVLVQLGRQSLGDPRPGRRLLDWLRAGVGAGGRLLGPGPGRRQPSLGAEPGGRLVVCLLEPLPLLVGALGLRGPDDERRRATDPDLPQVRVGGRFVLRATEAESSQNMPPATVLTFRWSWS
jgi:hypothetical protein